MDSSAPLPPGPSAACGSPLVIAVVVSYNARDLLRECLRSLAEQGYPNLRTVVVDNASTDGTREMVRGGFPDATLVECEDNLGFGPGADIGIRRALDEGGCSRGGGGNGPAPPAGLPGRAAAALWGTGSPQPLLISPSPSTPSPSTPS